MRATRLLPRVILIFIATARGLGAADLPLSAELEPVASTARAGAPIPVVWRMIWNGGGLLEGHLQLAIRDGNDVLARVRIDDIVLSGSEQRFRAMLPALVSSNRFGELTVVASFRTEQQTIELGEFPLRVPSQWQRWFGICLCAPWEVSDHPALRKLAGDLQLEQYHPNRDLQPAALASREMGTSLSSVSPQAMPSDPLLYCAFNLVVLDAAGFAELDPRQIDALRRWTDAAGNLCLFAHGNLSAAHVEFLNALAGEAQAPYMLDSQQRLMSLGDAEDRIRLTRYGLGRAVVLRGTADDWQNGDLVRWREIAAWLWRIRRDQQHFFVRDGSWQSSLIRPAMQEWDGPVPEPVRQSSLMALSPTPLQSGHQLLNRLMPQDIDVVPLSLIGLILFGYVLLIGPADYYVLGRLRQRKLTWIAFPAITVAVTLLTVWLSQVYMGTSATRRTLTFVDIGQDGTVARTSRFELLFTGSPQEVRTGVSQAILTPLDHQRLGGVIFDPQYGYQNPQSDLLVGPAMYAGRMPARYAVAQHLPQWTPEINGQFALAPELDLPAFDWGALRNDPRSMETDPELRQRLLSAFGHNAGIYLFNQQSTYVLNSHNRFFPDEDFIYMPQQGVRMMLADRGPTNFLKETSVSNQTGLFSLVSTVPPTGSSSFEDLVLLDPSNPNEWLLVVVVDNGDDLTIYRKLYVTD